MLADRVYLLGRRIAVTARFKVEHGWSWWTCWQMSRVHQRHMLLILGQLHDEHDLEREVEEWLASIPTTAEPGC